MGCNRLGTEEDKAAVQKEVAIAEARCHAPDLSGNEVQLAFERGGMPAVLALQAAREAERRSAEMQQTARFGSDWNQETLSVSKSGDSGSSGSISAFVGSSSLGHSGAETSITALPSPGSTTNAAIGDVGLSNAAPSISAADSSASVPTGLESSASTTSTTAATESQAQSVLGEHQSLLPPGKYEPTFDSSGRISANEGWLRLQPGETPSTPKKDGKDRGHLIGKQFGGSGDDANVIPMDPRMNRSFINSFEGAIADEVAKGRDIFMNVSVEYGSGGLANKLTYRLYERQGNNVVEAGGMVIDPNTSRLFTLKQGLGGKSAREFSNPFLRPSRQYDA